MELQKLFVTLALEAAEYTKGLADGQKQANSFADSVRKTLGDGLKAAAKVAATALAGVVTAVTGVAVAGGKAFIDFERGMNEVFTLLPGISQDAMDAMSDQVLELSSQFGTLPEEAIPALYQALSAGVPQDNVFSFLEIANKAAIGGVTDLETAVDGITSVVNAYGSEVLSAATASDVMFTAVRLGKTDFSQLSSSLFNVIPTAASLGVTFEDVAAQLAVMTAQGVPTSVATTQLRAAMVEASKGGTALSDAIKDLTGSSFAELASSGMTSTEIFQTLRDSMPEQEFKDLFGSVEALNAVLSTTGPNFEATQAAMDEMRNSSGATDAAFGTMSDSLQFTLDRLKAFGSGALIEIGKSLEPLISAVLGFAEGAMPALQQALDATVGFIGELVAAIQGGNIGEFFGNAFANLWAWVQPHLATLWTNITTWFAGIDWRSLAVNAGTAISDGLVNLWGFLEPKFSEMWTALTTWFAELDFAAIGDSIGVALQGALETVVGIFSEITNTDAAANISALGTAFQTAGEFIQTFSGVLAGVGIVLAGLTIIPVIVGWVTTIGGIITTVTTAVSGFAAAWALAGGGLSAVGAVIGAIVAILGGPLTVILGLVAGAIALLTAAWIGDWWNIRDIVATVWTTIQGVITGVSAVVGPLISQLMESIKASFGSASPLIESFKLLWQSLQPAFTVVGAVLQGVLVVIGGAFAVLLAAVTGIVGGIIAGLSSLITAVTNIVAGIVQAFSGLVEFVSGIVIAIDAAMHMDWEGATEGLKMAWQGVLDFLTGIVTAIISAIFGLIDTVISAIGGFITTVIGFFEGLYMTLVGGSIVPDMVNAIVQWFQNLWDTGVALFQAGADAVAAIVQTGFELIGTVIETAMTLVQTLIQAGWELITAAFETAVETVSSVVEVGFELVQSVVETAMAFVQDIITAGMALIQGDWQTAWTTIQTALQTAWTAIQTAVQTAVTGLLSIFTSAIQSIQAAFDIDWSGIGSNIVDGIKGGISGAIGGLVSAAADMARSALDAAKSALGISSPSKEFEKIGMNTGQGMAGGIGQSTAAVLKSIISMAKGIKTKGAVEFAEAAKAIAESIGPAIEAVTLIVQTQFPNLTVFMGKFLQFKELLYRLLAHMLQIGYELKKKKKIIKLADAATKTASMIGSAIDVFTKMAQTTFPPLGVMVAKMQELGGFVTALTNIMAGVANNLSGKTMDAATTIADTAGPVLDLVSDGIDTIIKIGEWDAPAKIAYAKIKMLADTIANIVWRIGEIGANLQGKLLTDAKKFSDAAETVLEMAGSALDTIIKIGEWDAPARVAYGKIKMLADTIANIVWRIGEIGANLSKAATDNAVRIADSAGKVLDLVSGAIDAIVALGEFDAPAKVAYGKIKMLSDTISNLVWRLSEIAVNFSNDALKAAEAFANSAGKALDLIEPAIEAVVSLGEFVAPVEEVESKIEYLNIVIAFLVDEIQAIAQRFSTEALDAAKQFANSAGAVLDLVEPAIDAIVAITEYTQDADLEPKLETFSADMIMVSVQLVDALTTAATAIGEDALAQAKSLAQDIADVAKNVADALDSIEDISNAEMPDVTPQVDYLLDQMPLLANALTSSSATINGTVVQAAEDFRDRAESIVNTVLEALDILDTFVNANVPGSLQDILRDLVSMIENQVPAGADAGHDVGAAIGQGIADGITSKTAAIAAAARAAAQAALAAANAQLGISSPSKEAMKIAGYFVDGFVRVLRDLRPIEAAASGLAAALLQQAQPQPALAPVAVAAVRGGNDGGGGERPFVFNNYGTIETKATDRSSLLYELERER